MPVADFNRVESERRSLLGYGGLILVLVGAALFATLLVRDAVPKMAPAPVAQAVAVNESVPDEVTRATDQMSGEKMPGDK